MGWSFQLVWLEFRLASGPRWPVMRGPQARRPGYKMMKAPAGRLGRKLRCLRRESWVLSIVEVPRQERPEEAVTRW